jgi:hypothetical protein
MMLFTVNIILLLKSRDAATIKTFNRSNCFYCSYQYIHNMNAYQQRWLEILKSANLKDWEIEAQGEDIVVNMPNITDLKLIRDNLPQTIALLSLDIDTPKERLKFKFNNNHEHFEYVLNPDNKDLTTEKD